MTTTAATDGLLLSQVDGVLFDLDGTLLDTARDLVRALDIVCSEASQPAPAHELAARYVSQGAVGLVTLAFPDADADELETHRQKLVNVYEAALTEHTRPYPAVADVIAELDARGMRWGVVTNKMRYLAAPILAHFPFLANCATLIGGDSATHNKPHPAPIQMALDELEVAAGRAIYVGDAEKDVIAGKAAGTVTVAVTWGYIVPGTDPYQWDADYTIESPQEFLALEA